MRFLVDTNVLSEPTRPRPDQGVLAHLERHAEEIATAAVVWHELRYGVVRLPAGARRDRLAGYLDGLARSTMAILDYDTRAAEWHAQERARLEATGRTPGFVDGLVAATAAVHDLTVVTRNLTDFEPYDVDAISWWA